MGASALCRCNCGKDFDGPEPRQALGTEFDALYEIDYQPAVRTPQIIDVVSYSAIVDQPLRGTPLRQGKLWYLLAEEKVELVEVGLYVNGFSFQHADDTVSVALSPFTLVRNCKFQETYSNVSLMDLKIFKLSLFTQNLCYYFGVRAGDDQQAEDERQRWVLEIARAVQLVTQSLFPPFRISCEPMESVVTTLRRLMAGYVIYHDGPGVATLVYCELHPHCDIKDHAKLAFYETDTCQRLTMEIRITVGTICCEKVGVNCSCFCIDGHQFSTRTCAERKLWLRAISNIKVKLQNCAPTPSGEVLQHYRGAIEEHIESIRQSIEGFAPIEPLLARLPRRPVGRRRIGGGLEHVPEHSPAALSSGVLPRAAAAAMGALDGSVGGNEAEPVADDDPSSRFEEGVSSSSLAGCTGGSGGPTSDAASGGMAPSSVSVGAAAGGMLADGAGCVDRVGCSAGDGGDSITHRVPRVGSRTGWQPKELPQPGDG
mmetsp:Transcript_1230/g.3359  ORF Transcript_1230/g.3359 Transcript_1230/m.3359 type:complete len:485 (+) Transcript_1230:33-1487(+)